MFRLPRPYLLLLHRPQPPRPPLRAYRPQPPQRLQRCQCLQCQLQQYSLQRPQLPQTFPPLLDIFPQSIDGEDWSWSDAPGSLTSQFVEDGDCHLSGLYGLRLVYSFTDNGNGGWGVHWANTPTRHFTATQFTAFTFSVRGTAPNGFQIGLKDTTGFEVKLESNPFVLASDSVWKTVTIPLNKFARQGKQVNIASVENINFGFHKGHDSGNICIDDIAFQ